MEIQRVFQLSQSQVPSLQRGTSAEQTTGLDFGSLFTQQLNETNQLQAQADIETQQFLTGESDNLHSVMIAMEEAQLALELTTQVRNKIVEAYQELKNTQL